MSLSIRLRQVRAAFTLDVGFEAPAGVTALFGPSGAGKTSVIEAIAGLSRPDLAQISLNGRVLDDSPAGLRIAPHKRRIGYVFQDARLFPHLSVRANLCFGHHRRRSAGQFDDITALLGLETLLERRPRDLSGGEKSRVAIGRALLSGPDILLLDEPLAALDAARKAEVLPYLDALATYGLPMLYVSHALEEVLRLAQTLVMLDNGQVTACGPVEEVLSDPDLAQHLARDDVGAVIRATLTGDAPDGLSQLTCGAGPLFLPRLPHPVGTPLRLRIRARDVMIARTPPQGLSALNILPATLRRIDTAAAREGGASSHTALVTLDLGGTPLLARLTRRSVRLLGLELGMDVFAVVKSVALAREELQLGAPPKPRATP
ncbi:Sulfate/thiosulfate import ATP-binding protein CysA [Aquimixticola soesokkakensis]|uniref:Sulfate/thiosulfate import ATP-binding protein CysA n=1 Tax=Aquimixticola soesokkakensis TaxID=1519096 RepID=A0A1Y5RSV3_9RHOB|nr:molybdenum ABC transporter ATP-binding protein [Aquimixticola soesokkakensis]SLN23414.1 Sulfate/thiosulfate import ATP-binding protein CysA [Aquimixticola soesokkakensis]